MPSRYVSIIWFDFENLSKSNQWFWFQFVIFKIDWFQNLLLNTTQINTLASGVYSFACSNMDEIEKFQSVCVYYIDICEWLLYWDTYMHYIRFSYRVVQRLCVCYDSQAEEFFFFFHSSFFFFAFLNRVCTAIRSSNPTFHPYAEQREKSVLCENNE